MKKLKEISLLKQKIANLEKDADLQKEIRFLNSLERLLEKYGETWQSLSELVSIKLESASKPVYKGQRKARSGKPRRSFQRALKTYINPYTSEQIQTRGNNHNILKAWKNEYGADVVEGWRVQDQDHSAPSIAPSNPME